MLCRNCGMQLADGAAFCPSCGTKVVEKPDEDKPPKLEGGGFRKKGLIIGLVAAVVVLGLGAATTIIVFNRTLDKKYVEVAEQIDSFQMPDYIEQKDSISSGWEKSGLLDFEDKNGWIEELEEIAEEAEQACAELNEIEVSFKELEDNKERYRLADSFSEYEQILKECGEAIQSRNLNEAALLLEDATNALNGVIEDNQAVIDAKMAWYEDVDLSIADANDVSTYHDNMDKISQLAESGEFSAVQEVFEVLDPIVYQYIKPQRYMDVSVQQVDLTAYPNVKLYVRLEEQGSGETPKGLEQALFFVRKENANGEYIRQEVKKVTQLNELEALKIDMVADVSGSMAGSPLYEAQTVMSNFVNSVQFSAGDQVELTAFSTGVYLEKEFTSDGQALIDCINALQTDNMTSLYDALYTAVTRVAAQSGAKCVIAFTDGLDNYSSCSPTDVIDIAKRYHVPIFIIGIDVYEYSDLDYIAAQTGGRYYDVSSISSMQDIYNEIYKQEKELYMVEFTDDSNGLLSDEIRVVVGYHSEIYGGDCHYSYIPNTLLSISGNSLYTNGPEATVEQYLRAFDDAMTYSDFSLIAPYLKEGSGIYTTQEKYVQKNITEQLDSYEIVSVNYSDAENCVVTTRETFYVQSAGNPLRLLTQECKYNVTLDEGTWRMTDFADKVKVLSKINQ